jgi:hypothetical protein
MEKYNKKLQKYLAKSNTDRSNNIYKHKINYYSSLIGGNDPKKLTTNIPKSNSNISKSTLDIPKSTLDIPKLPSNVKNIVDNLEYNNKSLQVLGNDKITNISNEKNIPDEKEIAKIMDKSDKKKKQLEKIFDNVNQYIKDINTCLCDKTREYKEKQNELTTKVDELKNQVAQLEDTTNKLGKLNKQLIETVNKCSLFTIPSIDSVCENNRCENNETIRKSHQQLSNSIEEFNKNE